ncbi:hypothetical protein LTR86_006502 [Recurvomyces mirabilis]|nr:hypothetical protein LTR86_006502 [Recurvomyces mirabilis]
MDQSKDRSVLGPRRPLPLSFGADTTLSSNFDHRTNDSVLLHDAAVQSATNLMAVVNDMLCSPPVSAHIMTQQRHGLAAPAYLRPRSHTAPSTPLVEASSREPVELPGSLLQGRPSLLSLKPPHEKLPTNVVQLLPYAAIGAGIERPHSSPQQATYDSPFLLGHFEDRPGPGTHSMTSQSLPLPQPATPRPYLNDAASWSAYLTAKNADPRLKPDMKSSSPAPWSVVESKRDHVPHSSQSETDTLQQVATIRMAHDNHIASLRTAHEHELESYRSYITFLEKRSAAQSTSSAKALIIDTTHTDSKTVEPLSGITSATTLVSLQSTRSHDQMAGQIQDEKQAQQHRAAILRPKSTEDARTELCRLREGVEKRERKISLLSRRWKDEEKSLRNTISDLESRLLAANNERLDTLEGLHVAGEQVRRLTEQRSRMAEDNLGSRNGLAQQHSELHPGIVGEGEAKHRPKHQRTRSEVVTNFSGELVLEQRNRDLQRQLSKAEATIRRLEQQHTYPGRVERKDSAITNATPPNAVETIAGLEIALNDHKQMLAVSRADCERYNELLHDELRRRKQRASQGTPRMTGSRQMSDDVLTLARGGGQVATASPRIHEVQTSVDPKLEYCMKQIVAHKLDIQGYKKALKDANAKVQEMETSSTRVVQRPPTPDRDSMSSTASSNSNGRAKQNAPQGMPTPESTPSNASGLGISLRQGPETPLRTVATATTAALLATTPPLPSISPAARPKTPMSVHKKLPKPPVARTPSPLPSQGQAVAKLQRGETLRSLSDSIISSYAKRMTPEQGSGFESQPNSTRW